jgi:hypothetical protein
MPIFAALETFRVRHSHASLAAVTMARVVALAVVTWGSFRFVESPFLRRSVA